MLISLNLNSLNLTETGEENNDTHRYTVLFSGGLCIKIFFYCKQKAQNFCNVPFLIQENNSRLNLCRLQQISIQH